VQQAFRILAGDDLKTHQIRSGLRKLGELRTELDQEYDRLTALGSAFAPGNLARIAKWSNDQAADQIKREAALENRKAPPIWDRFVVEGSSITDRKSSWPGIIVSLPSAYHPPRRTLSETMRDAISVEHEP
jgi:hypothetical protein